MMTNTNQETTMTTYQITSSAGVDMGTYEGETAADALDAMARDAGYESQAGDEDDDEDEDEVAYVVWGVRASRIQAIRDAETDWSDPPPRTWLDALDGHADADAAWCVCVSGVEESDLDADPAVEGYRRLGDE
jgi:hypothetical protein